MFSQKNSIIDFSQDSKYTFAQHYIQYINPLGYNAPFLYLPKKSENFMVFWCFRR